MSVFRPALVASLILFAGATRLRADSIETIVNQVTVGEYSGYLHSLYSGNGNNRGLGGAQHNLARDYILSEFLADGLTAYLDPFTYSGSTYHNVVGLLPGSVRPTDYYIIGAHYDSANTPGADDDGSGVAGVLEAAHTLAPYTFEASILFIAFDREEQNLVGSTAFASAHATDHILGMIELDMIGYNPAGANQDHVNVYTVTGIANTVSTGLLSALSTYGGLTSSFPAGMGRSDHVPFASKGFPSALIIESNWGTNPNYHYSTDSTGTANYIDYDYATDITRGAVGFLAGEADPQFVPEPSTLLPLICGLAAVVAKLRSAKRVS